MTIYSPTDSIHLWSHQQHMNSLHLGTPVKYETRSGRLDPVEGEEVEQTWHSLVLWGSGRTCPRFWGRLATLGLRGLGSYPPLLMWQFWMQGLLFCMSWWQQQNPVMHSRSKGYCQAEGVLGDHVGLWNSRHSWLLSQASCISGCPGGIKSHPGGVEWGYDKNYWWAKKTFPANHASPQGGAMST